jgi:Lon-like ATP-dependent protease
MGLAWTSMGGATLYIEARGQARGTFNGGGGSMKITGQLGEVMTESSSISLTFAKHFVSELDPSNEFLDSARVHLNVPEGAVPKDGPSAGVTMASALISLALDRPLRPDLAMTGELTLTGKVLKVGGIKEKVIAARREGVKTLILPKRNEADFVELKEYLRAGITAHFVDHYDDVYRFAFDEDQVMPLPFSPRGLPVVSVSTPLAPVPGEVPSSTGPVPLTDSVPPQPQPTPVPQTPQTPQPPSGPSAPISGKPVSR